SPIPTETKIPATETPTKVIEPTITDEPTPTGFDLGDKRTRPEDSMVMVYVPGGGFIMGSTNSDLDFAFNLCKEYYGKVFGPCERRWWKNEQPAHTVTLDPYWIDAYEVSNAQFRKCVEAGVCDAPIRDTYFGDTTYDDHPVVYVNWHQAEEYCDWANAPLPTEAELEYATRGPDSLRFPWGNQFDGSRVNYCDVNCEYEWGDEMINDGYSRTSPVGSYPDGASWSGALVLIGNVWEWAQDWYDATYFNQSTTLNPKGPTSGSERVRRGGSWHYSSDGVRGTSRFGVGPNNAESFQGFRCASILE
ncbi:formylglycine-generating enzyme family protein, partial [Chloroflexota bacterium]